MEAHSRAMNVAFTALGPGEPLARSRKRWWNVSEIPDFRPLVLPALGLAVWEGIARSGLVNPVLVPSLATIFQATGELALSGELWRHGWATLQRILGGLLIATILGLGVGLGCALSRWFDRLVGGPLAAIRQVPLFGWIPLIAVLAGIGEASKLTFVVLAAFYPIALNTTQAVRSTPTELLEVGQVLRLPPWIRLRYLLLPHALPGILTGLKQGLNFAGVAVVTAEVFMTASPGLGNLLEYGQTNLRTDLVLIAVATIGLLGYSITLIIARIETRLLRWRTDGR